MINCPLCNNTDIISTIEGPDSRVYRECKQCSLISVDPDHHISKANEKKRYLTHNNGIQNKGYVDFLNRAVEPVLPLLDEGMKGLDFGCGPTPTLSVMLDQQGYTCDNYDPIFFPKVPGEEYDFIFATECFEHFFSPAKEIKHIKKLLNPGGMLIIMTEPWKLAETFKTWYYARDETHVCFYHHQTINYIAEEYEFQLLDSITDSVFLLLKRE